MSDNTHIEWTDASWNPIRARHRTVDDIGEVMRSGGGEWTPAIIGPCAHVRPENAIGWRPNSLKGNQLWELPEDLRVREFPL